ncbi:M24 family metallopeptidase [Weissella kandleri]|uniref:M24 family metallopeptidase n=1 Tax=Weissella kandleri TaxID=1616 RepID=UPI00387E3EBD
MYTERIAKVRKNLQVFKTDGMLIADGDNLKYLSGFSGGTGEGLLLIGPTQAALITDSRYEVELREQLENGITLLITRDYYGVAMLAAQRFKIKDLGFEDTLPFRYFDILDETFEGTSADSDIMPIPELVEWVRQVKDDTEIRALRHSNQVAVQAFQQLLKEVHVGMTEREVANRLDQIIKSLGATHPSFETIVVSGTRGALPHGEASDKPLVAGEFITIDFGYFVDGYTSDITRTFVLGSANDEMKTAYDLVLAAKQAAVQKMRPGVTTGAVDQAARAIIEQAGYGANFNHATGHGVGLAIHEGPVASQGGDERLEPGMLLTIEPGIYLADQFGIRIEDDVIVTKNGFENLTADLTDELVIVD